MTKRWSTPLQQMILVCLLATAFTHAQSLNPVADPRSVVTEGSARFTVLTPELIRMEWNDQRQFEDRASLVFINRRLEPPHFAARKDTGWLVIQTDRLRLEYLPDGNPFSSSNLRISFEMNGKVVHWYPGLEDKGNLGGTIRTLDGVKGETKLEPGILSRDGWVLVDDSDRPLFDNSDWPWVAVRSSAKHQDWYFFAYGKDYRHVLREYSLLCGRIPMIPKYVLGSWATDLNYEYLPGTKVVDDYRYTADSVRSIISRFRSEGIPLDVMVLDYAWHLRGWHIRGHYFDRFQRKQRRGNGARRAGAHPSERRHSACRYAASGGGPRFAAAGRPVRRLGARRSSDARGRPERWKPPSCRPGRRCRRSEHP